MERLPLGTQTLYAELLDQLRAQEAAHRLALASGSFVTKTVKGQTYHYFQQPVPGGPARQWYVGRASPALDELIRRFKGGEGHGAVSQDDLRRLAAQLRAGGALVTDAASGRVLRALAEAGVFRLGGVLVGTHAFSVLGNVLGVRWDIAAVRTHDVDIARRADADLDVAVPMLSASVPTVLDGLAMGFLPVPPLNPRHPSTSFKVRGKPLRLDLLTPGRADQTKPVVIPRLGAAAQPLPFLGYVLEGAELAAVIEALPVAVTVPTPARFALHKLVVSTLRPAAMQGRAAKDLAQAAEVLAVLVEDRPGDVSEAWAAVPAYGARWPKALRSGMARLRRQRPEVAEAVAALVGSGAQP